MRKLLLIATLAVAATTLSAQTGALMPWVNIQFTTNNGVPLALGKVCTYQAGTNIKSPTYTSAALSVQNSDPMILDASGRAAMFIGPTPLKVVIQAPGDGNCPGTGSVIKTIDNVQDNAQLLKSMLASTGGAGIIGFSQSSSYVTGTVGSKLKQTVSVTDPPYNADPTGSRDSTSAFNSAFSDALNSTNAGTVIVPVGNYKIESTLAVTNAIFPRIVCAGGGSILTWAGNTTGPIIQFKGDLQPGMSSCHFFINGTHPLSAGAAVQFLDNTSPSSTSSSAVIEGNFIESSATYLQDGFVVNGTDANNDFHIFRNNRIAGYSRACFNLQGSQSYSHQLQDNQCLGLFGGATGQYAVYAPASGGLQASYVWTGGGCSDSVWDFYNGGNTVYPNRISGVNCESSGGLLHSGIGNRTTVEHIRWNGTSTGNTLFLEATGQDVNISNSYIAPNGIYNSGYAMTATFASQANGGISGGQLTFDGTTLVTANCAPNLLFPSGSHDANVVYRNTTWADPVANAWGYVVSSIQGLQYSTGTLTATNGATGLTGSGTSWTTAMQGTTANPGCINIAGHAYTLPTIASATSGTLATNFVGTTGAGKTYTIAYKSAYESVPTLNVGQSELGQTNVTGILSTTGEVHPSQSIVMRGTGSDGNIVAGAGSKVYFAGATNQGGGFVLSPYQFSSLPACDASHENWLLVITDGANSPSYNTNAAGGGGVRQPVLCDSANWKNH